MGRQFLHPVGAALNAPTISLEPGETKLVGRSPSAGIVIEDDSVSRLHLRLTMTQGGLIEAEDVGSTNGVFFNNERRKRGTLAAGDRLRIGSVEYLVLEERGNERRGGWDTASRVPLPSMPEKTIDRVALEALLATSRDLMAFTDLATLLGSVLDRLNEILKPDRAAILFYDATTGTLSPRAVRPERAYSSISEFASSTIVRQALLEREPLALVDVQADERFRDASSVAMAGVCGVICVPLFGRTGPLGALYADRLGSGGFGLDAVQYATAFAAHAATALETAKLYADREALFRATLEAFAKAVEARDQYTRGHSERVTAYTLTMAREIGLDDQACEVIRRGGLLHDIGKVGVPDAVLGKRGPLDPEERRLMEAHTTIGYNMLAGLPFLTESLPAIRGHHERWDGQGYPDRLRGDAIHPYARLMAVADAYDAMTSDRPYRAPLGLEEAARRVRECAGTQFDPDAVYAFDKVEPELSRIHVQLSEAGVDGTRKLGAIG